MGVVSRGVPGAVKIAGGGNPLAAVAKAAAAAMPTIMRVGPILPKRDRVHDERNALIRCLLRLGCSQGVFGGGATRYSPTLPTSFTTWIVTSTGTAGRARIAPPVAIAAETPHTDMPEASGAAHSRLKPNHLRAM